MQASNSFLINNKTKEVCSFVLLQRKGLRLNSYSNSNERGWLELQVVAFSITSSSH
jgi:hypothetical protein